MTSLLTKEDIITEKPLGKEWTPAGIRIQSHLFFIGVNYPVSPIYLKRYGIKAVVNRYCIIRARKIGEIHLEVISNQRVIFINPKLDAVRSHLTKMETDRSLILFSKFYMFFGDLLEKWEKIAEVSKAIKNKDIGLMKKLLKEAEIQTEQIIMELINAEP